MLCKGFLAAAGTKTPGQKIWFYSIRVPKGRELNKTCFLIWWILTAGEAKNVDNAVVLARLFNEASGQKAPSKKHGLFISRPLTNYKEALVVCQH